MTSPDREREWRAEGATLHMLKDVGLGVLCATPRTAEVIAKVHNDEIAALRRELDEARAAVERVRGIAGELAHQRDWLDNGHRASDYGHDVLIALEGIKP